VRGQPLGDGQAPGTEASDNPKQILGLDLAFVQKPAFPVPGVAISTELTVSIQVSSESYVSRKFLKNCQERYLHKLFKGQNHPRCPKDYQEFPQQKATQNREKDFVPQRKRRLSH
jgi:hypothetical protein